MTIAIDLSEAVANTKGLIDSLTYSNYRYNRKLAPYITAQEWVRLYGGAALEMEKRYQKEGSDE